MNMQASFASFAFEESSRSLSRIESTIREFSQVAAELDEELRAEEARGGIFDPKHFAYSCYAKAVTQRRNNLLRSVENLRLQLETERSGQPKSSTARALGEDDHTFGVAVVS
jgi:flagellar FliJ protein